MQKKNMKTPPRKVRAEDKNQAQQVKIGTSLVSVYIKMHKDNKDGHPHVIVDDIDNKYVSVGLSSHAKKGKNATNYTLKKNPLGGKRKSYLRRQGTVDDRKNYYSSKTGSMTSEDYERAKLYGERAKQKYIDEKKNKKSSNSAKHSN